MRLDACRRRVSAPGRRPPPSRPGTRPGVSSSTCLRRRARRDGRVCAAPGHRDDGRGSRSRTCDFRLPKTVLYQAELYPGGSTARRIGAITRLVGAAGFEPATSRPPDGRATRLRHAPCIRAPAGPHRAGRVHLWRTSGAKMPGPRERPAVTGSCRSGVQTAARIAAWPVDPRTRSACHPRLVSGSSAAPVRCTYRSAGGNPAMSKSLIPGDRGSAVVLIGRGRIAEPCQGSVTWTRSKPDRVGSGPAWQLRCSEDWEVSGLPHRTCRTRGYPQGIHSAPARQYSGARNRPSRPKTAWDAYMASALSCPGSLAVGAMEQRPKRRALRFEGEIGGFSGMRRGKIRTLP